MAEPSQANTATVQELRKIDQVCVAYEAARAAGAGADIAAFLDGWEEPARGRLFRELLATEWELASGPDAAAWRRRFPEYATVIDEATREWADDAPPECGRLAGRSLGPYRLTGLIGAGGMGEVYRAHDARLRRDVAVKVLAPRLAGDPDFVARFERESRAVAALAHPNVVVLYDIGRQDGHAYAVMELLEGQSLRERLAAGPLPPAEAVRVAAAAADGLGAAHAKGIVHRDVKPENVFLAADGRVKVLDFGLARLTAEDAPSSPRRPAEKGRTRPGAVVGTVGYMAPEQVTGGPADARCDVFALGVLTVEMLTGESPFRRDGTVATQRAILDDDPLAAPAARAVPRRIRPALRGSLDKSPGGRMADAAEFAARLRSAAGRRALTLAAALLLTAALGVALYLLWAGRGPDPAAVEAAARARAEWLKRTPESLDRAAGLYAEAVRFDPDYADAWAGLAYALINQGERGGPGAAEYYRRARRAAARAVRLDPESADGHAALGMIAFEHDWDFAAAKESFTRAERLGPDNPTVRQWCAEYLSAVGRHREAVRQIDLAASLAPRNSPVEATVAGVLRYKAGDFEDAIEAFAGVERRHPDFRRVHGYWAAALEELGRFNEAVDHWGVLFGGRARELAPLRRAAESGDERAYWQARYDLIAAFRGRYRQSEIFTAGLLARLGRYGEALGILRRAFNRRDGALAPNLKVNPVFKPLQGLPGYRRLLRDMGYPEGE